MEIINLPIQFIHNNILLQGVLNVVDNRLIAQLLVPFRGQKYVRYGWAAGVARSSFWTDKNGNFTEHGLDTARRLLTSIYEEARPEYKALQKKIKINELKREIEKIENE